MVSPLPADDVGAAARTLALAFADDPLMTYLAPTGPSRPRFEQTFFTGAVRLGLRSGLAVAAPGESDISGVAVWLKPGGTSIGMVDMVRAGFLALPLQAGLAGTRRFFRAMSASEHVHKRVEGPHWYLMAVGVRPDRQGAGLGSGLIAAGTDQADAAGLPCYLETATLSNVRYYEKRGFETVGETDAETLHVWGMVRRPR